MELITSVGEMQAWSAGERNRGRTIGFVPTMGALHEGHGRLLRTSRTHNDATVLSIFVNPTQFDESSDYEKYPRTWDADLAAARRNDVSVVFAPSAAEMYPEGFDTHVRPGIVAQPMEGLHRPGHFEGVATVVLKLFQSVAPHRAYFGAKDYQQLAVIRAMVRDLNIPVDVEMVPTVRDADGLALSSRNARLSPDDRRAATVLHRALVAGRDAHVDGERRAEKIRSVVTALLATEPRCQPEYVEVADAGTLATTETTDTPSLVFVAARFGDVRLIDNIDLPGESA